MQPRILIVRPDRIGDVVLSTPLSLAIKNTYPDAFIGVLVRNYTKDIYVNNPLVDAIFTVEPDKMRFSDKVKLIYKIRSFNFTHSISLLPTEFFNWILFASGIKYRIGSGHKFYQFITNTKSVYRRKYNPLRSEADYCLDTLRKMGIRTTKLKTEIFLTDEEKIIANKRKSELCPNKETLIGVHISSGKSAPNMDVDEYIKLIEKISLLEKVKVVVTDNIIPKDYRLPNDIKKINLNLSLRDSIINFSMLDYLISASTGVMHISAALNVNTISLFCPLDSCSPVLWGPQGNNAEIIIPSHQYCISVCPKDPKKCNFKGEGGIDAEKIVQSLHKLNSSL